MQQATTDQIRQCVISLIHHTSTVIKTVFLVLLFYEVLQDISISALVCMI